MIPYKMNRLGIGLARSIGLVSTGTQYINTGVPTTLNTKIIIDAKWVNGRYFFGSYNTTNNTGGNASAGFAVSGNSERLTVWDNFASEPSQPFDFPRNVRTTIIKDMNGVIKDGIQVVSYSGVTSGLQGYTMALFGANYRGTSGSVTVSTTPAVATIYATQLYESGVLLRDFVPIPQGSTVYSSTPAPSNCMWDKVTGQYFINAGSGEFEIEEG